MLGSYLSIICLVYLRALGSSLLFPVAALGVLTITFVHVRARALLLSGSLFVLVFGQRRLVTISPEL
jgi:hypothetical protein